MVLMDSLLMVCRKLYGKISSFHHAWGEGRDKALSIRSDRMPASLERDDLGSLLYRVVVAFMVAKDCAIFSGAVYLSSWLEMFSLPSGLRQVGQFHFGTSSTCRRVVLAHEKWHQYLQESHLAMWGVLCGLICRQALQRLASSESSNPGSEGFGLLVVAMVSISAPPSGERLCQDKVEEPWLGECRLGEVGGSNPRKLFTSGPLSTPGLMSTSIVRVLQLSTTTAY